MIDEETLENVAFYALDLMAEDERTVFEQHLRTLPEIAPYVCEMQDISADIARTAPAEPPDPGILANVLHHISDTPVNRPNGWRRTAVIGWAAAACLTAGWLWLYQGETPTLVQRAATATPDGDIPSPGGSGLPDLATGGIQADTGRPFSSPDILHHGLRQKSLTLIQDRARIERELDELKSANEQRFAQDPRVARTVVIEMLPPDTRPAPPDDNGNHLFLSERVSDYIATGIETETRSDEPTSDEPTTGGNPANKQQPGALPPVEEPTGAPPAQDGLPEPVIFDAAGGRGLPDLTGSPTQSEVYVENFPTGSDNVEKLSAGTYWDSTNQTIWVETTEIGTYVGSPAPEGFDPDFQEDFLDRIPAPSTVPAPGLEIREPAPVEEPATIGSGGEPSGAPPLELAPENTAGEPVPAPPIAYPVFDETSGKGSIIVGNLPLPDADEQYHLWLWDTLVGTPIHVGALPRSTSPVEHFEFDLGTSGISPAGFLLTAEKPGDVSEPGPDVILSGP